MPAGVEGRSAHGEAVSIIAAKMHSIAAASLRAAALAFVFIFALLVVPPRATAQQPVRQVQPDLGRTEKYFETLEREQSRAKRPAALPSAPTLSGSGDARPMFGLKGVTVEGATVLSGQAIADAYRPYLGRTVSQADLAAIAGRIGDLYRAAGYHLSRAIVPPQDVDGGRIRIQVIEGRITEVVVKGDDAQRFGVRPLLAPITAERIARRSEELV